MSQPVITIEDDHPVGDIRLLWDGLNRYSFSQTRSRSSADFRLSQKRTASSHWRCTRLDSFRLVAHRAFWLKEDQRRKGWGSRLLQATEAEAVKRGCRYSHLETFSFQVLGFYHKNGYWLFGELDKMAGDHK